jgi:DNA-binding beta-propeller fold protein YncE
LYVALRNGDIDVFDVASNTKLSTWHVGANLGGISVATDGSYLLATERSIPSDQSLLYKINTATGMVTNFERSG